MKTNKLLLCIAFILALAFGVMSAAAEPELQSWNGYYCTSGSCGINYYNYSYGWNSGSYYCPVANYFAPFQAEFIRDVTYPDGTYVMPGSSFVKTWRLRNVGTQAWNTNTRLIFIAGDPMNAVSANIPYYVAPGNTVDVSIRLTAPYYGGNVTGQWMLQAPDGTIFGVGCNGQTPIWVSVRTWTNGACACLGQPTCNCKAPAYKAGRNPYCNNKIRSIVDITYPDGSVVAPGATIRKTWRMKNGGTCVWDENYLVSFFYGDDLGYDGYSKLVPAGIEIKPTNGMKYEVNRPKKIYVNPGDTVYVSIDLKAPSTPGMYESYYKLRDKYGYEFGFGTYADSAFWVNIIVSDEVYKSPDLDAAEEAVIAKDVANTEVLSEAENTPVDPIFIDAKPVVNKCGEQSIALRSTDTGYEVQWTAVNDGTAAWDGYKLVKADSNPVLSLADNFIAVPVTAPGETAEVTFNVNLDSSVVSEDSLWIEFYMDSGTEGFCEFYFEAPAK